VCCSVLQCVAENHVVSIDGVVDLLIRVLQHAALYCSVLQCVTVCCSVSQCVAVCHSVLHCVEVCCSSLQRVAVHHIVSVEGEAYQMIRVLQYAALYCIVLQCVTSSSTDGVAS